MESQPELKKLKRRIFSYMDQDGIGEILISLIMIAFGFIYQSPALWIILIILIFPCMKLAESVRRRFTYPRTGYARFQKPSIKRATMLGVLLSLCISLSWVLMIYLFGDFSDPTVFGKFSPYLIGGNASAGVLAQYSYSRSPKTVVYAVIGIALGVYLSFVKSPETILQGGALWLLWYGVVMLAIGLIGFIRFILKYKSQPVEKYNEQ